MLLSASCFAKPIRPKSNWLKPASTSQTVIAGKAKKVNDDGSVRCRGRGRGQCAVGTLINDGTNQYTELVFPDIPLNVNVLNYYVVQTTEIDAFGIVVPV